VNVNSDGFMSLTRSSPTEETNMTAESNCSKEKRQVDAVDAILAFVGDLPSDDRLFVIQLAWMCQAQMERNEAAPPNGFKEIQQRQVTALERITLLVRHDVPDRELGHLRLGHLLQDGDLAGVRRALGGSLPQQIVVDDDAVSGHPI
jgi:hypothetical protein